MRHITRVYVHCTSCFSSPFPHFHRGQGWLCTSCEPIPILVFWPVRCREWESKSATYQTYQIHMICFFQWIYRRNCHPHVELKDFEHFCRVWLRWLQWFLDVLPMGKMCPGGWDGLHASCFMFIFQLAVDASWCPETPMRQVFCLTCFGHVFGSRVRLQRTWLKHLKHCRKFSWTDPESPIARHVIFWFPNKTPSDILIYPIFAYHKYIYIHMAYKPKHVDVCD